MKDNFVIMFLVVLCFVFGLSNVEVGVVLLMLFVGIVVIVVIFVWVGLLLKNMIGGFVVIMMFGFVFVKIG